MGQYTVGDHGRRGSDSAVGLLVTEFSTWGIVAHGDIGGLGKSPFEIVIALFAPPSAPRLFIRFRGSRNEATVGRKVTRCGKALDGADFVIDGQSQGVANARYG